MTGPKEPVICPSMAELRPLTIEQVYAQQHRGLNWSEPNICLGLNREINPGSKGPSLSPNAPTALKVTFQHIRNGPQLTFHELLTIENRLTQRFLRNHDFHEGTRALLIDKDKNPKWKPSTLEELCRQ
uniref:3-hydroxyisobutyryl-CoA hydrolase, mitochondrial n=1 Tax=Acrobeloides nanus TaxID=290746 RepID=A0A914C932_9BILA